MYFGLLAFLVLLLNTVLPLKVNLSAMAATKKLLVSASHQHVDGQKEFQIIKSKPNITISSNQQREKIPQDRANVVGENSENEGIDADIWASMMNKHREGHHVFVGVGTVFGYWQLNRAGRLFNSSRASSGISYQLKYLYEIKLFDYFGYHVGSSTNIFVSNAGKEAGFEEGNSFRMPSVNLGVNYTPNWQYSLVVGLDYSVDFVSGVYYDDQISGQLSEKNVGITLEGAEFYAGITYFYVQEAGVYIMYSVENLNAIKPVGLNQNEGHPLDIEAQRVQKTFYLGYTIHFF